MNKYSLFINQLKQYRRPIIIFIIISIVYVIGSLSGFFTIPSLKANSFFFNLKYKLAPLPKNIDKIVIVGIDDSDYYAYGKKWPWKRSVFANMVYKLIMNDPAIIGFDLAFVGKSAGSRINDILLSGAFKDAGNVIVATYFDKDGKYILPYQYFKESIMGYGFTNKPEDPDNVIRYTKLFERYAFSGDIIDYSFDLKLASAYEGASLKDIKFTGEDITFKTPKGAIKLSLPKSGIIPLNYSAKMSDLKIVSFKDIMDNKVFQDAIRNKIVLIGTTGEVFHDISFTPFGKMPGVGIIANTVLMLLNKDFIYEAPRFVNILLLLFLCLVVSIISSQRGVYYRSLLVIIILASFFAISVALVMNDISWDFFSIPIVVLAIYLTSNLANYAILVVQSIKIRKFVISDVLTGLPNRRYLLFKLENILRTIKEGEDISLVLFSIDKFQLIISKIGAEMANQVIIEVGKNITRLSRKTRGIDFISRYGEVEFCSVLRRTPEKGASAYADRVIQFIKNNISSVPSLSLNIGIADIKSLKDKSSKVFIKCAETALIRSRKEGVNKICIYNPKKDKVPIIEHKEEKEITEADLSYVVEELQEKYKEMAILVNKLRTAQEDVIKGERLSAIGKMAATIHHDLNKPIVNLRGILGIVNEDLSKVTYPELSTAKKYISSAVGEIERLEKLGETLKDLYRPKEKEILPVDTNQIMEEMLNLSSGQVIEHNIKLNKKLSANLPLILGDSSELKQVFLNLIQNAIESMPSGGELGIFSSVSKDREGMAEIKVSDTGFGIPKENLDKIFEAFFTTKKEEGAGLGLYASIEIAKKYGGTIQAESVVNKGSTFTVYLPFK